KKEPKERYRGEPRIEFTKWPQPVEIPYLRASSGMPGCPSTMFTQKVNLDHIPGRKQHWLLHSPQPDHQQDRLLSGLIESESHHGCGLSGQVARSFCGHSSVSSFSLQSWPQPAAHTHDPYEVHHETLDYA